MSRRENRKYASSYTTVVRMASIFKFSLPAPVNSAPVPLVTGVPQGSVLGLIQFVAYTTDISDTFTDHNLLYHRFADDTQMYDYCLISNIPILVNNLTACINNLQKSLFLTPSAAQPHKNIHLVWHPYNSTQAYRYIYIYSLTNKVITISLNSQEQ